MQGTSPQRFRKIKDDILSWKPRRTLKTIPLVTPAAASCPELHLCGRDHLKAHGGPGEGHGLGEIPKFALDVDMEMEMAEERIAVTQRVKNTSNKASICFNFNKRR